MILKEKRADITTYISNKRKIPNKEVAVEVDANEMGTLIEILTTKLYSNPIGTIVREYASNCVDAHEEAGVDEPIIVQLTQHQIEFVDFGIGLDEEEFDLIFCKILKSTKRHSNDYIGAFGLGSKSAFSYTSTFNVKSTKNKITRVWSLTMNSESRITATQLKVVPDSNERNGTVVTIPIKPGDYSQFVNEMREQLRYFDNVYFANDVLPNDSKIYKSKDYIYSGDNVASGRLHVCLGKVYYPIDTNILNLRTNQYNHCPIALRFDIGDFDVGPSREAIKWDDDAKKKLDDKLDKVKSQMISILKKQKTKRCSNIFELFKAYNQDTNITLPGEITFDLSSLYPYSSWSSSPRNKLYVELKDAQPEYTGGDGLVDEILAGNNTHGTSFNVTDFLGDVFNAKYEITPEAYHNQQVSLYTYDDLLNDTKYNRDTDYHAKNFLVHKAHTKIVNLFITKFNKKRILYALHLLSKKKEYANLSFNQIKIHLVESQWVEKLRPHVESYSFGQYLDEVELPKKYKKKKSYGSTLSDSEIKGAFMDRYEQNADGVKLTPTNHHANKLIDDINKGNKFVVYGTYNDRVELLKAFMLGYRAFATAQSNFKLFDNESKFIPIENIMETSYVKDILQKYVNCKYISDNLSGIFYYTDKFSDKGGILSGRESTKLKELMGQCLEVTNELPLDSMSSKKFIEKAIDDLDITPDESVKKLYDSLKWLNDIVKVTLASRRYRSHYLGVLSEFCNFTSQELKDTMDVLVDIRKMYDNQC